MNSGYLDDDERFVLTLRFGLGVPKRLSTGQIAEMAGTSKMWVKRMEQRALRKLRRPDFQFRLRPFSPSPRVLDAALDDQHRIMHYKPSEKHAATGGSTSWVAPRPGGATGLDGAEADWISLAAHG